MPTLSYTIERSSRKTVALIVNSEAELIVRAPLNVRENEIKNIVTKKQKWIEEKRYKILSFEEKYNRLSYQTGESVLYLGNPYTIIQSSINDIKIDGTFIYVPNIESKTILQYWLKNECIKILEQRAKYYGSLIGAVYNAICLSNAQKRWGSCSPKNNLHFSWKIIMCPITVIDYVIVHELSHIEFRNHNKAFWTRIKTIIPNYKECQEWLDLNRKLLSII
jgi:predicted metal-dependent hydrolase